MPELPSQYEPGPVEARWYPTWESRGYFHATPTPGKQPYTIVIPPPNVTGILHMGHALNTTVQDTLMRWKRMQGFLALWVPGTDHAGIATQNVVERLLATEGQQRQDLGRDAFVKRVWQWKEEYGNTIIHQLKRLGASCDWERTRFTMDEGLSKAVIEVFVRLYEEGLIYRGNYIVNWCPRCETALSDEEAPSQTIGGNLYYLRYPLVDANRHVLVATTRPETMLGDTAIAVHPTDRRYKNLIGQEAVLPLVGRRLKIIADDFVDPSFGTGVVKVTPAHDPNDFAMGQRHGLDIINVMTANAAMENVPEAYLGQDRLRCRQTVLEDLQQAGVLEKQEAHQHNVGHCYRCQTMIEPRLSLQWFVKMQPLAAPAIAAVKEGHVRFVPERWTKVYLNWMDNIRDWCISRQIWWGHRIPVWYCAICLDKSTTCSASSVRRSEITNRTTNPEPRTHAGHAGVIVSRTTPTTCPTCGGKDLRQDADVLDTWFSSWLWPLSTLGWPDDTEDLQQFYPTATLSTAQEIIFFWVARMIMAGVHFTRQVPFREVYIHGTVRDLTGKKMSKSLGNIIDPLEIMDKFGCDALRFSLITAQSVGTDVFIGDDTFVVGRNFANKLWNATRFTCSTVPPAAAAGMLPPIAELDVIDRWLLTRLQDTIGHVTRSLEQFRLSEAAMGVYDFVWGDLCDWYLELAKERFHDARAREHTATVLIHALESSLRLAHPFIPFVTEELWQHINKRTVNCELRTEQSIMLAQWPVADEAYVDAEAADIIRRAQGVIAAVRKMRIDFHIPPKQSIPVLCRSVLTRHAQDVSTVMPSMQSLAGIATYKVVECADRPKHMATALVDDMEVSLPLDGVIDVAHERQRLITQRDTVTQHLTRVRQRLRDTTFTSRAPEDVIAKERAREQTLQGQQEALERYIQALA